MVALFVVSAFSSSYSSLEFNLLPKYLMYPFRTARTIIFSLRPVPSLYTFLCGITKFGVSGAENSLRRRIIRVRTEYDVSRVSHFSDRRFTTSVAIGFVLRGFHPAVRAGVDFRPICIEKSTPALARLVSAYRGTVAVFLRANPSRPAKPEPNNHTAAGTGTTDVANDTLSSPKLVPGSTS